MAEITKTGSTRDIGRSIFDDDFSNLFEGFFRPSMRWPGGGSDTSLTPATDVTERDNHYIIKADLPGVKKDDIHVTLENGVLTINAEIDTRSEEKEGDRVIRKERRYGKYVRSMQLGQEVDESKVKAAYKDGVLELTLPKRESAQPKKIEVNIG